VDEEALVPLRDHGPGVVGPEGFRPVETVVEGNTRSRTGEVPAILAQVRHETVVFHGQRKPLSAASEHPVRREIRVPAVEACFLPGLAPIRRMAHERPVAAGIAAGGAQQHFRPVIDEISDLNPHERSLRRLRVHASGVELQTVLLEDPAAGAAREG